MDLRHVIGRRKKTTLQMSNLCRVYIQIIIIPKINTIFSIKAFSDLTMLKHELIVSN